MARMMIISSATDLRTYVVNSNPGGTMDRADDVVVALQAAPGRPAWGEDWSEWLEANAERLAIEATS